jgi:threonylcarbamoyladenosine tRNA methylthiotransferase MtaB
MIRVAIRTTGCKVNQADSDAIRSALAGLPVEFVDAEGGADIVVVNACAVTAAAERDGRAAVFRARRSGAGTVVLSGCMAARLAGGGDGAPDGVRLFAGTRDRSDLLAFLRAEIGGLANDFRHPADDPFSPSTARFAGAPGCPPGGQPSTLRSRPLVKVQDGCDCSCSYCVVPRVRGPSRSSDEAQISEQVLATASAGAGEVVITGVDLASWGRDLTAGRALPDLLAGLVAMGTGLRFRLSSLEPHGLDDRLAGLLASSPDLCPHLHVPLQSGSDAVLAAMNRPYRAAELARRVEAFAARVPGIAFGYDVICGFPGETDADFEATRSLLASLPLAYLHVFPFSPRPGTPAASMPGAAPAAERSRRCAVLRAMSARARDARAAGLAGREVEVVDIRLADGGVEALAADYTRVLRQGATGVREGRFRVRVLRADHGRVIASTL